jgi:hypothetical protein
MAASAGPNLGLVWGYAAHDDGWGLGSYNPAMALLDAITFLSVKSLVLTAPPGSPAAGDRYIVAATATGAWAGHEDDLTIYRGGSWAFYTPKSGWRTWDDNTESYFRFDGAAWVDDGSAGSGVGAAVSAGGDWNGTSAWNAGVVVRDSEGRFFEASEDIAASSGSAPSVLGTDLQGNQGASTVRALTTSGDVTMLVAYVGLNTGATVTSISCSLGSFTRRAIYADGGASTELWYLKIDPTTLTSVNITFNFSANVDFVMFMAGVAEAQGFDPNPGLPTHAAGNTITGVNTTNDNNLLIFISRSSGLGFDSTKDPTGFTHWGGNTYLPTTSDASYKQVTAPQTNVTLDNSAAGTVIASTVDAVTSDNLQPIDDPRWVMLSTFDDQLMSRLFGSTLGVLPFRATGGWEPYTLSDLLDEVIGDDQGTILVRTSTGWEPLAPGTSGQILTINGSGDPDWLDNSGVGGTGLFSQLLSALPTSAGTGLSTWLNQGTATVADAAAGILLTAPSGGGDNIRGRYMNAPSTPYTKTALIAMTSPPQTNTGRAGFGWYDGSAKLQALTVFNSGANGYGIDVENWTNVTTFSSQPYGVQKLWASPVWLRISDDGTTVKFQLSSDGMGWTTLYSIAKASGFLGSSGYSKIIFFVNANGVDVTGSVLSFT